MLRTLVRTRMALVSSSSSSRVPALAPALAPRWAHVVPRVLHRRGLMLTMETPETVRTLYAQHGRIATSSHVTDAIETMVQEAYVDRLYDDAMHCASIRDAHRPDYALGIVFWRDLEPRDMRTWMKPQHLHDLAQLGAATLPEHDNNEHRPLAAATARLLPPAPPSSSQPPSQALSTASSTDDDPLDTLLTSLELDSLRASSPNDDEEASSTSSSSSSLVSTPQQQAQRTQRAQQQSLTESQQQSLAHSQQPAQQSPYASWIKIELIAARPEVRSMHLGSILLASCFVYATLHRQEHAVLHVAGGAANLRAVHLYEQLGFRAVPAEWFHQSNRDMFVCLSITRTLRALDWHRVLGVERGAAGVSQQPLPATNRSIAADGHGEMRAKALPDGEDEASHSASYEPSRRR